MKRKDSIGLFWQDMPKEVIKCTPPERTWERPDYLPGLDEAIAFNVPQYQNIDELIDAHLNREKMLFDVECYPNYFIVSFCSFTTGKVVCFEFWEDTLLDTAGIKWMFDKFTVVSFNGISYDIPILSIALNGASTQELWEATEQLITFDTQAYKVLKSRKVKRLQCNHIDLFEHGPLNCSLKMCAARLFVKKIQDLPFKPGTELSNDQRLIVKYYNINDLVSTAYLLHSAEEAITLREALGADYGGLDLRSKSDAQIAEAVIGHEIEARMGSKLYPPRIDPGTRYKYNLPPFIAFQTPMLQEVLSTVVASAFVVSNSGSIELPESMKALADPGIKIANSTYIMRIGGLHSHESATSHFANDDVVLVDRDVRSYYPYIILNQGLYPEQLGLEFLNVYRGIVERRITAKIAGDKVTDSTLKIVINGSFGKLGSMFSILYSPQLLIQVTITGQLSLLMLIEALELSGISVVSANTDGIVIKCQKHLIPLMDQIVAWWETTTSFVTEAVNYKSIHSRDVNNYIAVKLDNSVKTKGIFAKMSISKNPTNQIVIDAVSDFITKQEPITNTIKSCSDIRKFLTARTVRGGAVKNGQYLGKVVRWYYGKDIDGAIIYALSGKKVPKSDGAIPCQELPNEIPEDLNYDWYITEALDLLEKIGYPI